MASVQTDHEPVLSLTSLISKVQDPPIAGTVVKAMKMILDPDAAVCDLQLLISRDPVLSAKILRIVNSAMYSLLREVSKISHAVAVLGIDTVKSVIMMDFIERVFRDAGKRSMCDHSWGAALAARSIARRVQYPNSEAALACGLMHDIGKAALLQNYRHRYGEIIRAVCRESSSFHRMELLAFGFSHAHVGAMMVKKWGLPPPIAEGVGYHHSPLSAPAHRQLACIVNLANLFMVSMGIGFEKNRDLALEKQASARHLNLDGAALAELASEIKGAIQAHSKLRR